MFGLEWLRPLLEDYHLLGFSSGCLNLAASKEGDGILLSESTNIDSLTPINVPDVIWGRRIFVHVVEVVKHHANVDVRASLIVNTGVVIVQYGFKLVVIKTCQSTTIRRAVCAISLNV